jgi:hypothetical protein
MTDILNSHSVQFISDSSNVDFDVVALDLSGQMTSTFTFKDIFYQRGFADSDSSSVAVIDVSAADYQELFKLNVPLYDPSAGTVDTEQVRYLTQASGWTDVSFSSAEVSDNPIFTSHLDQSIKKDFLRSMLKDITGTTRLNNLFKNQATMVGHIESLDSSFNEEVSALLTAIEGAGWLTDEDYGVLQDGSQNYSFDGIFRDYSTDPTDLSDVSAGVLDLSVNNSRFSKFNPLRILSSSILGEEDADAADNLDISGTGLGNTGRREYLINDLSDQLFTFWNDISATKYIATDANSLKWDVWVTNTTDAQTASAAEKDGGDFSKYLDGYKLYAVRNDAADGSDNLITQVVDKAYDLEFLPGDRLHVLVTYRPLNDSFSLLNSGATINNRTYEVILNMT